MMGQTVEKVVVWTNGMVTAFDAAGQQVPEYQGRKEEVLPRIRADFPQAEIKNGDWNRDVRPFLGQR